MLTSASPFIAALLCLFLTTHAFAQPSAANACPFKAAELQTALGATFSEGRAQPPLEAGGIKLLNCRYESKNYSVQVNSTVYLQNPADAKKSTMAMAGKFVPVPGDPDGAVFQEGQGDLTSPAVHYARNGVAVELRILGIYYKDSSTMQRDLLALREKLAKLRRVP